MSTTIGSELTEELAESVRDWLKVGLPRSQTMLAKHSGTSQSTIRRIIQGEVEAEHNTAMKIAQVVMSEVVYRVYVKKLSPNHHRYSADIVYPSSEVVVSYLGSPGHLKVVALACSIDGTDEEEITRKFGEIHVQYFRDLQNANVITLKGRRWFLTGDVGNLSDDTAASAISTFAQMVVPYFEGSAKVATSYACIESVNVETARTVNKHIAECCEKIFLLIKEPENRGNILITIGLLLDVLKGRENI